MPRLTADPLPPGCPWSGFTPPNVDWCERELCAWVVNPADTVSNLAYVAVAAWMFSRIARGANAPILRIFAVMTLMLGFFSAAYHASYTYLLQIFDFLGMFAVCFTLIVANAVRLGRLPAQRAGRWIAGATLLGTAAVPLVSETRFPIQAMVGVLIAVILAQEALLRRRAPAPRYGPLLAALGLMAVAGAFSTADLTRAWCDPDDHWLQGHALWHVFSAAALAALFIHIEALEGIGAPAAGRVPAQDGGRP